MVKILHELNPPRIPRKVRVCPLKCIVLNKLFTVYPPTFHNLLNFSFAEI
jgi:hypothetical protein